MKRGQRDRRQLATGSADFWEQHVDGKYSSVRTENYLNQLDRILNVMVDRLDERERYIIKMRHGLADLGCKPTFGNLGRELGISKERVRQLEIRALETLRAAADEFRLSEFLTTV